MADEPSWMPYGPLGQSKRMSRDSHWIVESIYGGTSPDPPFVASLYKSGVRVDGSGEFRTFIEAREWVDEKLRDEKRTTSWERLIADDGSV